MERATIKHAKSRIDGSVRLASVLLSPLNYAITAERCLAAPLGFQTLAIAPAGGPKCWEWVTRHRRESCLSSYWQLVQSKIDALSQSGLR